MSEAIDPNKYIVFKREDFLEVFQGAAQLEVILPMSLPDAVVIRRQDLFAAPALHAYANNIAMAIRMLPRESGEEQKHLMQIADYFHEQAMMADELVGKLPD